MEASQGVKDRESTHESIRGCGIDSFLIASVNRPVIGGEEMDTCTHKCVCVHVHKCVSPCLLTPEEETEWKAFFM